MTELQQCCKSSAAKPMSADLTFPGGSKRLVQSLLQVQVYRIPNGRGTRVRPRGVGDAGAPLHEAIAAAEARQREACPFILFDNNGGALRQGLPVDVSEGFS